MVVVRDEQTREFTLAWPVMRRAVLRIGEALVARGALDAADDVFFLTRTEALAALGGTPLPATVDVAARRATREEQAKLLPPPFVGTVNRAMRSMPGAFARMVGASRSERALVSGSPASPGRATGECGSFGVRMNSISSSRAKSSSPRSRRPAGRRCSPARPRW